MQEQFPALTRLGLRFHWDIQTFSRRGLLAPRAMVRACPAFTWHFDILLSSTDIRHFTIFPIYEAHDGSIAGTQ